MHEHALIRDVVAEVERVARAESSGRVTRIGVRLGALSHFTAEHFREHFEEAARGTVADGAAVDATLDPDPYAPRADAVVLESVEVEA
jgi:hydrogenase nickel incorporation protein HypA/HybF